MPYVSSLGIVYHIWALTKYIENKKLKYALKGIRHSLKECFEVLSPN